MFESPQTLTLNSLDVDAFDAAVCRELGLMRLRDFGSRRGNGGRSTLSTLSPQDVLTPRVLLKRAFGEGPKSDGDNSTQLGTNCGPSEIQLESLVCFLASRLRRLVLAPWLALSCESTLMFHVQPLEEFRRVNTAALFIASTCVMASRRMVG